MPEKPLTKIDEVVYCLKKNMKNGFYGKIIETYEADKMVHRKIEITVKEDIGK